MEGMRIAMVLKSHMRTIRLVFGFAIEPSTDLTNRRARTDRGFSGGFLQTRHDDVERSLSSAH